LDAFADRDRELTFVVTNRSRRTGTVGRSAVWAFSVKLTARPNFRLARQQGDVRTPDISGLGPILFTLWGRPSFSVACQLCTCRQTTQTDRLPHRRAS
jgi:hypothetical protein